MAPRNAPQEEQRHHRRSNHTRLRIGLRTAAAFPANLGRMHPELQTLARACGKSHVHNLEPEDLVALTVEAAAMARVPLAGTDWIPGS